MKAQFGRTVKFMRAALDREQAFIGELDPTGHLRRATLYHDPRRALGFELDLTLSPAQWADVRAAGAFEITPDKQGAVLGDGPRDDAPVEVTVFMRPARLKAWFEGADDAEALADRTRALLAALEDGDEAVCAADGWVFLSVGQAVPGRSFEAGYRHIDYEEPDSHLLA